MTGRNTSSRAPTLGASKNRVRAGWIIAVLIAMTVLAVWLTDLHLPLGDSDDGRILARFGLSARNFWELGATDSRFGARIDPYIRGEFVVEPGTTPPDAAVTYAHHPPLHTFITILSVGVLGNSPAVLRIVGFLLGAATILFLAGLARILGMAWGPILIAVAAMAATGFFFVYGRIGVGFSLVVACIAMVAYLRREDDPERWVTVLAAVLAALAAMQSWIAMAATGLSVVWLLASKGMSTATRRVAVGALAGVAITAGWLLLGSDAAELGAQVTVRTQTGGYPLQDFLSRQWRFARELTPGWFRAIAPFALVAGLADRRTRIPVAITLGVAAAWTFGLRQGAWIHRLWNFPWIAPITIGMVALSDLVRRYLVGRRAAVAGGMAAVVIGVTFYGVVTGNARDTYLHEPARAGAILEQASPPEGLMWVTPGIPTARWASYYLEVPVWKLEERYLDDLGPDDLVLLRTDRMPEYISLPVDFIAEDGRYRLVAGDAVRNR